MSVKYAIGVDVGGTNVKGVAVDQSGKMLVKRSKRIGNESLPHAAWSVVVDGISQACESPRAFGLAAPGIAGRDGRSIWWMQGRLDELQDLNWSKSLHFWEPIHVLNDAHAALLGELWQGAAKGSDNVIMLTLGTGVGGAAIVDGRLLRGHLGRAGHLGHISLNPDGAADIVNTPGSLEDAIGDCTIHRRSGGRFNSTADLLAVDDDHANEVWSKSIHALACGLASLINVLDPELIVLGGGMIAAGPKLFDPLAAEMEKLEWRPHGHAVRIVPASAGEYAGALGAAYNAIQQEAGKTA